MYYISKLGNSSHLKRPIHPCYKQGEIDAMEILQLIDNKGFFETWVFCPSHGIMEWWNIGMSKIPSLAGLILLKRLSSANFL
jgi:hypothetical protein